MDEYKVYKYVVSIISRHFTMQKYSFYFEEKIMYYSIMGMFFEFLSCLDGKLLNCIYPANSRQARVVRNMKYSTWFMATVYSSIWNVYLNIASLMGAILWNWNSMAVFNKLQTHILLSLFLFLKWVSCRKYEIFTKVDVF